MPLPYSPIPLLNLDLTLPVEDGFHATNDAGIIRYITAQDARSLEALNRLQGDLAHRFQLGEAKLNSLIALLNNQPALISFDNSPYVLRDGSHGFTAPISSPAPVLGSHLTNRTYVDGLQSTYTGLLDVVSSTIVDFQGVTPIFRWSDWTPNPWSAGTKTFLDLTLATAVVNESRLLGLTLMERSNVGTLDAPVWRYRQVYHGSLGGTAGIGAPGTPAGDGPHFDDVWLLNATTVRVLIPNTSSYPTGYAAEANYDLASPIARELRAVVLEARS